MPTRTGPPTVAGRWSLLPDRDPDPTRRAQAAAEVLLDRHGVLTRGAVMAERTPGGFAAVYKVLSAYEEAGRCRRGYFVEGLGAAQFGAGGAIDRLRATSARGVEGPAGAGARRDRPRKPLRGSTSVARAPGGDGLRAQARPQGRARWWCSSRAASSSTSNGAARRC